MKGSKTNGLGDSIDDSISSSSSSSISSNSAFKPTKSKNDPKLNTIKPNDRQKKTSFLDDNPDDNPNDVELLKPTKAANQTKSTNPFENDDFYNNTATKGTKSTVGELPPLTNTNFQNKFFSTSASKELDKKLENDDNYDDDFTK